MNITKFIFSQTQCKLSPSHFFFIFCIVIATTLYCCCYLHDCKSYLDTCIYVNSFLCYSKPQTTWSNVCVITQTQNSCSCCVRSNYKDSHCMFHSDSLYISYQLNHVYMSIELYLITDISDFFIWLVPINCTTCISNIILQ